MDILKSKKAIKLGLIVVYFVISITVEIFYNQPLFEYSLTYEQTFQKNVPQWIQDYFKFITGFGTEKYIVPVIVVVIIFVPLSKVLAICLSLFTCLYLDNVLKLIYHDPRPYWVKPGLQDGKHCDLGFGNPSGHSYVSTGTYLAIWCVITDYSFFTKKIPGIILRFFLCGVFLLLIITIMLSRIFLGVHSLNQIIYGSNLGLGTFLLLFWVLEIHKFTPKEFFEKYWNAKLVIFILFGVGITTSLLLYFFIISLNEERYRAAIELTCGTISKTYRLFKKDGLYGSMCLFAMVGAFLGHFFLKHFSEKHFPNHENFIVNWQQNKIPSRIVRALVLGAFGAPISLTILIKDSASDPIIYIFKCAIPYLITGFLVIGPGIYFGYLLARRLFPNSFEDNHSITTTTLILPDSTASIEEV